MIDLSHGEFRALVAKAFRGAGYTWGLTEEVAYAAGYLAEAGFAAAESVVQLLSVVDGRPLAIGMPNEDWLGPAGVLCPICVGTSLVDRGGCEELTVGATAQPLLIAPFLLTSITTSTIDGGTADRSGEPGVDLRLGYTMTWDGGRCEVASTGMTVIGELPVSPVALTIYRGPVQVERQATSKRVQLSDEHFGQLEQFAHRVYAPATEASRAAGAGAGATDND